MDQKAYIWSMKLQIAGFTFNPFQENTYIVYNDKREAVIVDPGCYTRQEQQALKDYIDENQLEVLALLNTHAHIDHVLGNDFVCRTYGTKLYLHELDIPTLERAAYAASLYGIEGYEPSPAPDVLIADGETLSFGDISFRVIFGPGHAPGHVAFYNEANGLLLGGDILFRGSFGRYDLPGGDLETLKMTIKEKIFTLPGETVVYSGHGPATTIGVEKQNNPILQY